MKDAGLPGARIAPPSAGSGISSERDRLVPAWKRPFSPDTRRDYISMNRAVGLFGKRREPDIRGSCEAGAGVGAALNIITLVSEKSEHPLMPSAAPELIRSGGRCVSSDLLLLPFPFPAPVRGKSRRRLCVVVGDGASRRTGACASARAPLQK